jgi:hypothetical protein
MVSSCSDQRRLSRLILTTHCLVPAAGPPLSLQQVLHEYLHPLQQAVEAIGLQQTELAQTLAATMPTQQAINRIRLQQQLTALEQRRRLTEITDTLQTMETQHDVLIAHVEAIRRELRGVVETGETIRPELRGVIEGVVDTADNIGSQRGGIGGVVATLQRLVEEDATPTVVEAHEDAPPDAGGDDDAIEADLVQPPAQVVARELREQDVTSVVANGVRRTAGTSLYLDFTATRDLVRRWKLPGRPQEVAANRRAVFAEITAFVESNGGEFVTQEGGLWVKLSDQQTWRKIQNRMNSF